VTAEPAAYVWAWISTVCPGVGVVSLMVKEF
jgi:hypothetical protein